MTAGMYTNYGQGFMPNPAPYQYNTGYAPQYAQAGQPAMQYAQNPGMQTYQTQQYQPAQYSTMPNNAAGPGIVNYVNAPAMPGLNSAAAQNFYPSSMPQQGIQPGMPANSMNTQMNAQMPAPNMQQGQGFQDPNDITKQTQPPLDVGVVDAPQNFSKTPVIDALNRKGLENPREHMPSPKGKKKLTLGNISAACTFGALGIILTMGLTKIFKIIKH